MPLRLVFISDTHGLHRHLIVPEGDILIHAGDITQYGELRELIDFDDWLAHLKHPHKIVIAGNHDFCCEQYPEHSRMVLQHCLYLQDEAVILAGLKFYGSPWQPPFYGVFNAARGEAIQRKWANIPEDTEVLITHGPPHGYGDRTTRGQLVGCRDLSETVGRIRPKVHAFGHIHEGAGVYSNSDTIFLNASACDEDLNLIHSPAVLNYEFNETLQNMFVRVSE